MDINNGTTFGKVIVLPLKGEKGDSGDAGDYSALTHKPSINNVQLNGDLASEDLGIASTASVTALSNTVDDNYTELSSEIEKREVYVKTISSLSSLPHTVSDSNIESDMVAIKAELSVPSAQTGDWTVDTSSGSLTISGSIDGTTNVTLYLMKSR